MKFFRLLFILMALLVFTKQAIAEDTIVGKWQTYSDEENDDFGNPKKKSVVEIWKADAEKEENGIKIKPGLYYGRIIRISDPSRVNSTCEKCASSDPRKDKPNLGMIILTDIAMQKPGVYEGDNGILDPKKGKVYDVKLWLEEGKVKVRGYIGFLFRTQEWLPYKEE